MVISRINIVFFLVFALTVFCSGALSGQVDRVTNRAKRKTEQKIDRSVDKSIDKGFDAIEGLLKKKKGPEGKESDYEGLEEEVEYSLEGANSFIGSFRMQTEVFVNGQKDEVFSGTTDFTFDSYKTAVGFSSPEKMVLILNHQDNTMIKLVETGDGKKQGFKMRPMGPAPAGQPEGEMTIKKTDQMKEIEGFSCYKYLITGPDYRTTAWVYEGVAVDFKRLVRYFSLDPAQAGKAQSTEANSSGLTGLPMESFTVFNDGTETKMWIKNLETGVIDITVFDLSGVEIRDMTGMEPYPGKKNN